jgi:hypothetical protein
MSVAREYTMPKHTSTVRRRTQRNKSQTQKNIRLVHQDQDITEKEENAETLASDTKEDSKQEIQHTLRPGSAAAKIAARRQATLKVQQRATASLITAEHFAYVKQDLIRIGIFAVIMFTAIIALYLTIGHA